MGRASYFVFLCLTLSILKVESISCAEIPPQTGEELWIEMRDAFREALAWSPRPADLIHDQASWESSFLNHCPNKECLRESQDRIASLVKKKTHDVALLHTLEPGGQADQSRLNIIGIYAGGDKAAESIFGKLEINSETIGWGGAGTGKECLSKYTLVGRQLSKVVRKWSVEAVSEIKYTIRLENLDCYPSYRFLILKFLSVRNATMGMSFSDNGRDGFGSLTFYFSDGK